jgi:hypothetical protein
VAFTLRLDAAAEAALARFAQADGVSQQEVIRRLLTERAERERLLADFDTETGDVLSRRAELLERLRTA